MDHVDPGLRQRPLYVRRALLVGPGQISVHVPVVRPEDHPVAARLEVGRRLLDLGPGLDRRRGGDDRDRRLLGQRGRLDPRQRIVTPGHRRLDQLGRGPERAQHQLHVEVGHPVELERPVGVEPQRDPGALEQDRVGRDPRIGDPQRAVADAVLDQRDEDLLVGVPLCDQRPARRIGERSDFAVGHERLAAMQAVEHHVLADRGGELQRRGLEARHRGVQLLGQPLHELVLEVDQDRFLRRVPVVDRGGLDPRGGRDRTHRGRVIAEPREQVHGRGVDRIPRLGAPPSPRAAVPRGGFDHRCRRLSQATTAPSSAPGWRPRARACFAKPTAISTSAAFDGARTPLLR